VVGLLESLLYDDIKHASMLSYVKGRK